MINKKYTVLLFIITVLSIILISTMFLKNKGYSLPELKPIKSNIVSITINRGTNEIIYIKFENNKWVINEKYNADESLIISMTNILNMIQPVEIVSRGKDNDSMQKYKLLEDEAIKVTALDSSSKEVRNIQFGMKSSFGNSVYSKINNDNNIYLIGNSSSNPKDAFDKSVSDLVNKTISSIRNDNIDSITIEFNDEKYILEKSLDDSKNWLKTWNNTEIDADDIYTSVFSIANLKADGLSENSINEPILYKIAIKTTDNYIVSYKVFDKNNDNYSVLIDDDNNVYYLLETSFDDFKSSIDTIIK